MTNCRPCARRLWRLAQESCRRSPPSRATPAAARDLTPDGLLSSLCLGTPGQFECRLSRNLFSALEVIPSAYGHSHPFSMPQKMRKRDGIHTSNTTKETPGWRQTPSLWSCRCAAQQAHQPDAPERSNGLESQPAQVMRDPLDARGARSAHRAAQDERSESLGSQRRGDFRPVLPWHQG
jgi:hypothetical protein